MLRSSAFKRLSGAAALGKAAPPVDRRYLVTGMNRDPFALKSSVKSEIISHLQMLYESVAETLADVRDDSFEPEDGITVAQEGTDELQDGYAALQEVEVRASTLNVQSLKNKHRFLEEQACAWMLLPHTAETKCDDPFCNTSLRSQHWGTDV